MRALLVVNEFATATTPHTRKAITQLLRAELGVDVEHTQRPGHAAELASIAAAQGVDVVIALGGDGTVNEAASGLLRATAGPSSSRPALAALPGGNANVFARNIGFSPDPLTAAHELIAAFRAGRRTEVGIGRVESGSIDRVFLANAGIGLDAAVIAAMARRRSIRQHAGSTRGRPSDLQYARIALAEYLRRTDRTAAALDVEGHAAALALIVNLSPWTYLGARALDPQPRALLDDALAVYAPASIAPVAFARLLATIARGGDVSSAGAYAARDVSSTQVACDRPMWLQVDGESVGRVTRATFSHIPRALQIVV